MVRNVLMIWGAIGTVDIEVMGKNIFVFHFQSLEDWAMIYNIPLLCMTTKVVWMLVESIGSVVEIPLNTKRCWGRFIRIKIRIDITKLLKRGVRVWLEEFNTMITAPIKYKKLLEFYFACGMDVHSLKDCLEDEAKIGMLNGSNSKYAVRLHAPMPVQFKGCQKDEVPEESSYSAKVVKGRKTIKESGKVHMIKTSGVGPKHVDEVEASLMQDVELECLDDSMGSDQSLINGSELGLGSGPNESTQSFKEDNEFGSPVRYGGRWKQLVKAGPQ
ncbi:hypothetical protein ACOSQ3_028888 [Xanthoceras sorbifolium]